jgi:Tol biopolymer transport system component
MFASSGSRPFSDAIEVIGADGEHHQAILMPERGRSYLFASGKSLHAPLVVLVHEAQGDSTSDRLYLYDRVTTHWSPIDDEGAGGSAGVVSPDGRSIVSIRGAAGGGAKATASRAGVWLFDLQNKTSTALIADSPPVHWHTSPAWRPNGKQIGLLDLRRGERGLALQLVMFDMDSKREEVILSPAGAFCFSPDGAQVGSLTAEGVEVLNIASRERKLIVPWSQLHERIYNGGGITWSRYGGKLAIGLFEKKSQTSEIWTIPLDGRAAKDLYSAPGRIRGLSFIDP